MTAFATVRPRVRAQHNKPGLHSHNAKRRLDPHLSRRRARRFMQVVLFLVGLSGISYYVYSLANEYIYQVYENWAFDQHIAGRKATLADYVREKTPFGFLAGQPRSTSLAPTTKSVGDGSPQIQHNAKPTQGTVLGRVEIARLNLSAIVREGVDDSTLSRAVGHLPSTALPGAIGNFSIAAHRDTLFRALKDIHKGDEVIFKSVSATYTYKVIATIIVRPSDVSVIEPQGSDRLLTMITCYPFYYVGSAPHRFIVQAKLIDTEEPHLDPRKGVLN